MPAKNVYVPCYTQGADGKFAYEFIKLTGVLTTGPGNTVPEGECCINSRVVVATPPTRLQPRGNQ